jgi:hypothetical protein
LVWQLSGGIIVEGWQVGKFCAGRVCAQKLALFRR